jgi:MFS family permease
VPLLFQEAFGWSPIKSGGVVLFVFVGNVGIKPATTFLYSRLGFRAMLIASTALMAATMVIIAFTTAATPVVVIGLVLVLSGVARSAGGTGYTTIAFSDVPEAQMRDANTLQATAQQLSLGFGLAAGAIALRAGHPLGRLLSSHYTSRTPNEAAFVLLGLLSLVATFGASRLDPGAGDALRRARARPSAPRPTP